MFIVNKNFNKRYIKQFIKDIISSPVSQTEFDNISNSSNFRLRSFYTRYYRSDIDGNNHDCNYYRNSSTYEYITPLKAFHNLFLINDTTLEIITKFNQFMMTLNYSVYNADDQYRMFDAISFLFLNDTINDEQKDHLYQTFIDRDIATQEQLDKIYVNKINYRRIDFIEEDDNFKLTSRFPLILEKEFNHLKDNPDLEKMHLIWLNSNDTDVGLPTRWGIQSNWEDDKYKTHYNFNPHMTSFCVEKVSDNLGNEIHGDIEVSKSGYQNFIHNMKKDYFITYTNLRGETITTDNSGVIYPGIRTYFRSIIDSGLKYNILHFYDTTISRTNLWGELQFDQVDEINSFDHLTFYFKLPRELSNIRHSDYAPYLLE